MRRIFLLADLCLVFGLTAPRILFAESGLIFDQTQGMLTGQLNVSSNIAAAGSVTASSATLANTAGAGLTVSSSAYLAVAGGNVGIGTTTPGDKLEVSGNVFANAFNAIGTPARYYATGGAFLAGNTGSSWASLQAYSDVSGTGKNLALNQTGGNVGIGTTGPGAPLDVRQTAALGGTAGNTVRTFTTGTAGGAGGNNVYHNEWRLRDATGTDWVTQRIHDGLSVDASFWTPGTDTRTWWERDPQHDVQSWGDGALAYMTISGGNVGIGTTSPGYKLDVNGSLNVGGNYTGTTGSYSSYLTMASLVVADPGAAYYAFGSRVGGTLGIVGGVSIGSSGAAAPANGLLVGGNVGIGTTGPSYKLSISGTGVVRNEIIGTDAGSTAGLFLRSNGNTGGTTIRDNSKDLEFFTATNGQVVTIKDSGNVGIGTTSPGAKLAVAGDVSMYDAQIHGYGVVGTGVASSGIQMYGDAVAHANIAWMPNERTFAFHTGNGARATTDFWGPVNVTISGAVGIGTTAPGTKAEVYRLETLGRQTYTDLFTISAGANTSPYTGHGGGILFRATNYDNSAGTLTNSARIGSIITNNSLAHTGANLFFDVTPLDDGALSRAMTIQYDGNVGIGTTSPAATLDVGGTAAIKIPVGTTAQRPASPANGMLRINTTTGKLEYYNDGWNSLGAMVAAGGNTVTDSGGYRYHTFTSGGTLTVTVGGNVDYLVVAGGGGGGAASYQAGGGGAGGYLSGATTLTPGTYSVTVGGGGASATNGANSTFGSVLTAIGGGRGGWEAGDPYSGGSGGGGSWGGNTPGSGNTGGAGTTGQGNKGGDMTGGNYENAVPYASAGGGGAGAVGASTNKNDSVGGVGGVGLQWLNGNYYAGGGGGCTRSGGGAVGGNGGGGTGRSSNGAANTGGGGGAFGYSGGSGIVIIRYMN